jgi:ABC-type phosphate transport system substrate-binding protein
MANPSQKGKDSDTSDFRVIVNQANCDTVIRKDQLSRLFLKKVTRWSNGGRVLPVDQLEHSTIRSRFSQIVHEKTVNAVKAYWQIQVFSGRGVPPPEKRSDADVIEFVREHKGAIGYISGRQPLVDVKLLRVTQ